MTLPNATGSEIPTDAELEAAREQRAAGPTDPASELVRSLVAFFARQAARPDAARLDPRSPDFAPFAKWAPAMAARDSAYLSRVITEPPCRDAGTSLCHSFIIASAMLAPLLKDASDYADLAEGLIKGAWASRGPGGVREKRGAAYLAAFFHDLIHGPREAGRLHPAEAAMKLVSWKSHDVHPRALRLFVDNISVFPPGSLLRLNNGWLVQVLRPNPGHPTRPVVWVFEGQGAGDARAGRTLDLGAKPLLRVDTRSFIAPSAEPSAALTPAAPAPAYGLWKAVKRAWRRRLKA